jgi:hypothetical protein
MFYILGTHPVLFHQSKMLCDFLISNALFVFTAIYCNFSGASLHTVGFHCALSWLSLADDVKGR